MELSEGETLKHRIDGPRKTDPSGLSMSFEVAKVRRYSVTKLLTTQVTPSLLPWASTQ